MQTGRVLANCCHLCQQEETTCPSHIGTGVWSLLFTTFGITWALLETDKDTLISRCREMVRKGKGKICLLWCIWKEYKRRVFDGLDCLKLQLKKVSRTWKPSIINLIDVLGSTSRVTSLFLFLIFCLYGLCMHHVYIGVCLLFDAYYIKILLINKRKSLTAQGSKPNSFPIL